MARARHRARAGHWAGHWAGHRAGHAVRIYKKFVYIEIDTHDLKNLHNICTPLFKILI